MAVVAVVVALSGCGGGGDSSADPQEVLDQALGGGNGADSGVLDLTFDLESSGGQEGSIDASVQGPFQSNGDATLPSVDLDVHASVDSGSDPSFDFDGGLTLTSDGAFVGLDGQEYQLDDSTFQAVKASYEQSAAQQQRQASRARWSSSASTRSWVTDLTNEGTEDLDGTEVVHVSGTADVPKIVADLNDVAQQTGQGDQRRSERAQAASRTRSATRRSTSTRRPTTTRCGSSTST